MNGRDFIQKAIDNKGRLSFDESRSHAFKRRDFDSERDWLRECVLDYCDPVKSLVSIAFKRQKLTSKTVRAENIGNIAYDHGEISFDLAPVLLIDNSNLGASLYDMAVLRSFLDMCASFVETNKERGALVRLMNERDRHNKTLWKITFLTWPDSTGPAYQHAREAEIVRDMAQEYPFLGEWFRTRALDLNKLGAWSSMNIDRSLLFGSAAWQLKEVAQLNTQVVQ